MSVEMAIWRMSLEGPVPMPFSPLEKEKDLEDMIVKDPTIVRSDLMVVGRQVSTDHGGFIDVLAVDSDGHLHVLEVKRDRTPREVVAQALDYGSWVRDVTLDQVEAIFALTSTTAFADAFVERFGAPVPDVFNADQQLTVVASALDAASDRIITYLAENYAVPVNAVFFRSFTDGDQRFLARTWLIAEGSKIGKPGGGPGKVRAWNGRDFYCVLGTTTGEFVRWEMGRRYGFVSAGGKPWYWKPLRNLQVGHRVFAYVGGAGYVGVGEVTGEFTRLRDLDTDIDGPSVKVVDQPDIASAIRDRALLPDDDATEYAVPVRWLVERPIGEAVMEPGLFASQVPACKLRDERTISFVTRAFGLAEE